MAARPDANFDDAIIVQWTVTAASTTVENQPVTLTAEKTCRLATAGEKVDGIAMQSKSAAEKVSVALCIGSAIIPVKVGSGGTATAGAYAEAGTGGLTNRTLGGGTNVRHIAGKFTQDGVAGDIVGLMPGQFAGVSA